MSAFSASCLSPSIPSGKQRTSSTALLRKKFIGLSQTCWSWRTLTVFGAAFRKGFPRTWEQRKLMFAVLLLFQSKRPRQGILSERQQTNPWFKILNFPHLFPRKFISPWLSRLLRLNYNVLCAKGKVSLNDPKYGKVCVYVSVFLAKDIYCCMYMYVRPWMRACSLAGHPQNSSEGQWIWQKIDRIPLKFPKFSQR